MCVYSVFATEDLLFFLTNGILLEVGKEKKGINRKNQCIEGEIRGGKGGGKQSRIYFSKVKHLVSEMHYELVKLSFPPLYLRSGLPHYGILGPNRRIIPIWKW